MAMLTEIRLLKRLATVRPADLPDELVRAEEAARQGLDEARKAIVQLRSNPVQELGLGPALAETLRSLGERSGLDARLVVDGAAAQAADARAEALYRIAEELLRNVERHARAHHVTVSVRGGSTNGALQIEVRDDGVGFDPAAVGAGHYGLVGVREQAEAIGAHVEIQSDAGVGTRVIVEAGPSALPGDGHAT
jgi:signal transduction histidine kinase